MIIPDSSAVILGNPGLVAQPDLQGTWVVAAGGARVGPSPNGVPCIDKSIVLVSSVSEAGFDDLTGILEIGEQTIVLPAADDTVRMIVEVPILYDTTNFFDGAQNLRIVPLSNAGY